MIIDFEGLSSNNIYHLMTQTVIPRPIAWVLTDSGDCNYNLAPFSYFTAVSSAPPLVMLSIGHKPNGDHKDTYRNAIERGKLVIHIASDDEFNQVTKTSATLQHGESEIELAKLELETIEGFELPRLKNAKLAFACSFYEEKQIGDAPQHLVFAKVEKVFLDDDILTFDENNRMKVNADRINPLSRLGANEYAQFGNIVSQARPK